MSEQTRTKLNAEQKTEQVKTVKAIAELTEKIKEQAEKFEGKSVKQAYLNSVANLEKKNDLYGKERETLTDEEKKIVKEAQKKALADFRSQKQNEISSDSEEDTEQSNAEVQKENEPVKHGKKGKKSN